MYLNAEKGVHLHGEAMEMRENFVRHSRGERATAGGGASRFEKPLHLAVHPSRIRTGRKATRRERREGIHGNRGREIFPGALARSGGRGDAREIALGSTQHGPSDLDRELL